MKRHAWRVLAAVCGGQVGAHGALPADVQHFAQRRALCDHFRGEDPFDAERRKFLESEVRKRCTGTDRALAALKLKYRSRKDVLAELDRFEADSEGMESEGVDSEGKSRQRSLPR